MVGRRKPASRSAFVRRSAFGGPLTRPNSGVPAAAAAVGCPEGFCVREPSRQPRVDPKNARSKTVSPTAERERGVAVVAQAACETECEFYAGGGACGGSVPEWDEPSSSCTA